VGDATAAKRPANARTWDTIVICRLLKECDVDGALRIKVTRALLRICIGEST
jgi:hypothetical protein